MKTTFTCAVRTMRIPFMSFCFVFISFFCSAQGFSDKHYWTELMRYNYLPIDSLWLFHPGNDFSSMDSNNAGWEIANTELLQNKNGGLLSNQGVGWYQKRFDVPVAFRGKPVALRMGHFGASEIFLDGKLIKRYGVVGSSIKNEEIFVPREPVIIYLDNQASHRLLVRFSNLHANRPGYANEHIGFRLLIAPPIVFPQTEIGSIPTLPVSVGIMLLFSIFFLFVWFFYPKRLASLITVLLLLNFCVLLTSVYFTAKENEWEPLLRASNIVGKQLPGLIFFHYLCSMLCIMRGKCPVAHGW